MAEETQLILSVDTTSVVKADAQLDSLAAAGARTEAAAVGLEKGLRTLGAAAGATAENLKVGATSIIGIGAGATTAVAATGALETGLKKVGAAAGESASGALKLEKATAETAVAIGRLDAAAAKSAAAQKALSSAQALGASIAPEAMRKLELASTAASAAQALQAVKAREATAALAELQAANTGVATQTKLAAYQSQQLGFQLHDFFVQVSSGQSPLTALIQQGSQLSGTFGGIKPALAAVGKLFTPLVVGAGGVIAAIGGIALAFTLGASESRALALALQSTGNAAGLTEGKFNAMAASLATSTKTGIGSARETLLQLAATGRFSAESLGSVGEAVTKVAKATGQSTEDVVKSFTSLTDGVAKGAESLNKQFNFLTIETYRAIKALEDQGNVQGAVALTTKTLSGALGDQTANLGTAEKAWIGFTSAVSKAFDAVKGIGRTNTTEDLLKTAQAALDGLSSGGGSSGRGTVSGDQNKARKAALAERIGQLVQIEALELRSAKNAEDDAIRTKAALAIETQITGAKSDQAKLEKEIADFRKQAALADTPAKDIAAVVRKITEDSAAEQQRLALGFARIDAAGALSAAKAATQIQTITQLRDVSAISQIESIERIGDVEAAQLTRERELIFEQIKLAGQRKASGADVKKLEGEAAVKTEELARRRLKTEGDINTAIFVSRRDAAAALLAIDEEEQQAVLALLSARQVAQASFVNSEKAKSQAIDDTIKIGQLERSIAVYGERAGAIAIAQLKEKIQLRLRLDSIAATPLDADERARREAAAQLDSERRTAEAIANINFDLDAKIEAQRKQSYERTFETIRDGLADAILSGGRGGIAGLKAMFKNLVLRPVIQSLVSPLAGGLTSLVTGQTGAGSALTGGANLFNAGVNAYGLASGVNTLSGALYGSALGSSAVTSVAATYAGAGTAGANFGGLVAIDTAVAGTAAGSAAGAAGSLSAALGSVPVYGWIALAVVAAAAYFSKEVTPHVGGYVASDSLGRLTDITAQQGGIKNSDTQKAVASLVTPLTAALNATAKTFGQEAGFGLRAVFESDSTDPSFGLFSVLKDGAKIGGFDALGTLDKDPIKGLGEFSVLAAASVRDALLSVDLPMWASDALKAIADSAGVDAVVKVADDINATQAAFVALGKHLTDLGGTFALIGGFSSDATFKLVQAAGGLDALSGALSSYYENFYSDAERNTTSAGLIAKALAEVSIAVPSTVAGLQALGRDGFRALVDAAAAVGDTAAVSALLGVSEAFAELTPGVGAFAEATRSAADILNERAGLETKLLQAQGDTAGLRARELAGLDESNRGIQQHINEIEDATAAQAVADKRLADHAAAAAAAIDQIAAASRRVADAGAGVKSALQNIADFGDAIRSDIASTRSAINDLRGQALTQLAAARGAFVAAIKDMGAQAAAAAAKVDAAAGTLASARLKVTSAITALASALDTQGARVQSAQGAITSAQEAITAAYVSAADRVRTALQSLADGVTSATSAVASVRSRITDAYLGAVRENETAQQRLVDLQKQAAQVTQKQATDLRSFSGSIVEFLARLNGAEVGAGAAQYGASSSRFTSLAQAAISGDASAFSGLTDAARIFLDSSKNNAKTAQQFDADTVRVRQLLSQAQAVAAATGSDPAAATLDLSAQIAQAQADAAHTLSEVERLRAIAEVAGAATAQPAIDLLGEYRAAQAGLTAAQSAYNTAASTAAGFGVTLGAAGSEFAAAALALGAAVDAVTTSGASRAAAETDLLAGYTKAVADLSAEQAAFAAMVRQLAAAGVDLTKADTTGAFDKLVIDFAASVADVAAAEAAHTLAVSDSTAAALAYTAALDTAAGLGVAITADLSALSVATTDFAAALATANAVSASTFDAAAGVVEQYQTLAARLLTLNGDLASFELRTADLDFSGLAQLDPLGTLLQTYAGAVKTLLDAVADQSRLKATETFVDIGGGLERYTSTGGASLVRSAGASLAESTLYAKDGGAVNGQAAADWVAARFAEGDLQAIYDKAIALGVSSRSLQALSGVGNDVLAWATAHGLPAFAGGGSTRGGLYLAGERGPELINSGPARIWNAAETASIFGGGDMAGEIRALRDEVKALRADRRADMPALVDAARSTAKTLTSWDAGGGAYVQTESGVTLTTSL